jgi:hypothetical protein
MRAYGSAFNLKWGFKLTHDPSATEILRVHDFPEVAVDGTAEEDIPMRDKEESKHDQPWGTDAHGRVDGEHSRGGTGVGGASLAGTPAGPAHENAEAETSGLRPPVGTPDPQEKTGPKADPPRGPGAFAEHVTPPPVYDE